MKDPSPKEPRAAEWLVIVLMPLTIRRVSEGVAPDSVLVHGGMSGRVAEKNTGGDHNGSVNRVESRRGAEKVQKVVGGSEMEGILNEKKLGGDADDWGGGGTAVPS